MSNWYYAQNGSRLGPVSQQEVAAKLAAGELKWDDLVWREGMAEWAPASSLPELSAAASSTAVTSAPPLPEANPFAPYSPPRSNVVGAPGQPVPTYLWQSIVVTFFCCLPFGIPAIVYASKVEGHAARGDYAAAHLASSNAKKWCWISFWSGLGVMVLYFGAMIVLGATGAAAASAQGN